MPSFLLSELLVLTGSKREVKVLAHYSNKHVYLVANVRLSMCIQGGDNYQSWNLNTAAVKQQRQSESQNF